MFQEPQKKTSEIQSIQSLLENPDHSFQVLLKSEGIQSLLGLGLTVSDLHADGGVLAEGTGELEL